MLPENELTHIEQNYDIAINPHSMIKMNSGHVNQSYKINARLKEENRQYLLKKINLAQYAKEYLATVQDIRESFIFSETVSGAQEPFGNIITPIRGAQGVVFEYENSLFILYPYIEAAIKENQDITTQMVSQISQRLYRLHHQRLDYDSTFSTKKFRHIVSSGTMLITHPIWKNMAKFTRFLFDSSRFKTAVRFMANNQRVMKQSLESMSPGSVCHNDLKPKNVLWNNDAFWIIDWEAASDFDHRADYLDTLIAWCVEEKGGKHHYEINREKVLHFQKSYAFQAKDLHHAMNIVILKWYFWFCFNLIKCLKNPTRIRQHLEQVRLALGFIDLLVNNQQLDFLK